MTSTVLDVTVMLLCVSASVVALGAVESDSETERDAAADVADRLATETATVSYEVNDGDHDSRTVHATLAELLATAVGRPPGTDGEIRDRFRSRVIERVTDALGGRTRVDVRYESDGSPPAELPARDGEFHPRPGGETAAWTLTVGSEPPASTDVTAAVLTHPGSKRTDGSGQGRVRIVVRAW
ncbi:DUF7284 family protein [Halorubrum aethiopicum]|uniref:DUF7284 family protein n=1 Tax=Halorubrum aethiopicum TaxID=1758255 RepID=UPI000832BB75|nr:hypothetical protein [Halorubrum aethiopicum]